MEDLILKEFEKLNSKTGHVLMLRNLNYGLFQKLNPKQQDNIQSTINGMIENGLITYGDGTSSPECLRLTELGFNQLYKNSMSIEQIEGLIMKEFEKQNLRAGHILMLKNLNLGLFQKLNPKESELFVPAINNLIDRGFITYEGDKTGVECLRLTELGYESLY